MNWIEIETGKWLRFSEITEIRWEPNVELDFSRLYLFRSGGGEIAQPYGQAAHDLYEQLRGLMGLPDAVDPPDAAETSDLVDGWIRWNCSATTVNPEDPDTLVEVKFRQGMTHQARSSEFAWDAILDDGMEIVAYRVVPLVAEPADLLAQARGIAASCWCEPETQDRQMDPPLAEAYSCSRCGACRVRLFRTAGNASVGVLLRCGACVTNLTGLENTPDGTEVGGWVMAIPTELGFFWTGDMPKERRRWWLDLPVS